MIPLAILTDLLLLALTTLCEERLLTLLLRLAIPRKVPLSTHLVDYSGVERRYVDGGLGRDHVAAVDAAERDAVDFEGAGDEENALVEGLEEDDALAAEAAREQDQDAAGLEGGAGFVGAERFAVLRYVLDGGLRVLRWWSRRRDVARGGHAYLLGLCDVLGWVVFAGLLRGMGHAPLAGLELLGLRLLRHRGRLRERGSCVSGNWSGCDCSGDVVPVGGNDVDGVELICRCSRKLMSSCSAQQFGVGVLARRSGAGTSASRLHIFGRPPHRWQQPHNIPSARMEHLPTRRCSRRRERSFSEYGAAVM